MKKQLSFKKQACTGVKLCTPQLRTHLPVEQLTSVGVFLSTAAIAEQENTNLLKKQLSFKKQACTGVKLCTPQLRTHPTVEQLASVGVFLSTAAIAEQENTNLLKKQLSLKKRNLYRCKVTHLLALDVLELTYQLNSWHLLGCFFQQLP